ncbi:MAG: ribonuclease III domain-containing protein, partial [Bacteroidales bacterium]
MFLKRKNTTYILDRREFAARVKGITGSRPDNLSIYEAAFIHRSASFSLPDGTRLNNERLEFLGDAVLDVILSDYLFEKFPEASEGFMTKIRSRIVNRDVLNQLAISMGLDKLLVSKVNLSNSTRNIYGDALEALMGALFLDKGFSRTRKIFIRRVFGKYLDLETIVNTDSDYKSLVFEWVQKHRSNLTFTHNEEYDFKQKKSVFSARLLINNVEYGAGQG